MEVEKNIIVGQQNNKHVKEWIIMTHVQHWRWCGQGNDVETDGKLQKWHHGLGADLWDIWCHPGFSLYGCSNLSTDGILWTKKSIT